MKENKNQNQKNQRNRIHDEGAQQLEIKRHESIIAAHQKIIAQLANSS
jgi:hypothetical protein